MRGISLQLGRTWKKSQTIPLISRGFIRANPASDERRTAVASVFDSEANGKD